MRSNTRSTEVSLTLWSVQVTQENRESGGVSQLPQMVASGVKVILINDSLTDAAT